jgi:competence protein ComEA
MREWIRTLLIMAMILCGQAWAAVDINHATELDLDSIKGIGPSTARKILVQRQVKRFENWQDFIARVPGIGEKKAARMSESGLTVNGQRYGSSLPAAIAPGKRATLPADPFPSGSALVEWPQRRP